MTPVVLWRAVQFTSPVSGFFALAFTVGLVGPDLARGGAVFGLVVSYFFLMARVAEKRASAKVKLDAFDWLQMACYWAASVGVAAPLVVYWITRAGA